jgi:hypothetical protein
MMQTLENLMHKNKKIPYQDAQPWRAATGNSLPIKMRSHGEQQQAIVSLSRCAAMESSNR